MRARKEKVLAWQQLRKEQLIKDGILPASAADEAPKTATTDDEATDSGMSIYCSCVAIIGVQLRFEPR